MYAGAAPGRLEGERERRRRPRRPRDARELIFRRSTTVSVYVSESVRLPSVTWTMNVKSPVAVGVPEISPFELERDPGRQAAGLDDQTCEPPPSAVSWKLYGSLRNVDLRAECVLLDVQTLEDRDRELALGGARACTRTATADSDRSARPRRTAAALVGVPLIRPLDESESPGGSAPESTLY